ncbi:alpha/beta fold hydrolase [Agromyces intestinalis]|nr:alpha/beta hydrolase [Agromyces intestinalis]
MTEAATTNFATSADGTRIAFDREGAGPPVVLIGGAMQYRAPGSQTAELARQLASHGFEVVEYDRRGRGDSPADPPITLAQTLDDLRAVIGELTEGADDAVALFGNSSGGAIALAAAAAGLPVSRIVVFEVPLDDELGTNAAEDLAALRTALDEGGSEAGIAQFMSGMPPEWFENLRQSPEWERARTIGPSLVPDLEVLAWTQSAARSALWAGIAQPVLALVGSEAFPFMRDAADSMVANLPHAEQRAIEASDHRWEPRVLALAIAGFLVDGPR